MAWSLRRRKIAPMPQRHFGLSMRRGAEAIGPSGDDYVVESEERPRRPSAVAKAAQILQIVMIAVIAALTLAVVWLLGLLLDVF